MARKKDWTYDRGSTWNMRMTWKSSEGPINITGFRFRMQWRASYKGAALATFDSQGDSPAITITDSVAGRYAIKVTHELTKDIVADEVFYDLYVLDASEEPLRLMEGKITLTPRVTKFDE